MPKKFAYCIGGCRHTEPWLDALKSERSDRFVAYFKSPGPEGTHYLPDSTTNTGRNSMYELAKLGDYEYIVMIDDDVEFVGLSHAQGFRKLEALVDEFNPAIAVPKYSWHFKGTNQYSQQDDRKRVQGLNSADAIVNAFHRDVWPLFFPYWCGGDSTSWWNAQQIVHRICATLLPGAFVQFNDLEVVNLKCEPYPRKGLCDAADAYLESMTQPDWKSHILKFREERSFHEHPPLLRESYKLMRAEVGRYFDLSHPYWAGRF